jgi:type VI secretion system protein ImpH
MASAERQTTDSLIGLLEQEPQAFDFFRAVRLLESVHAGMPRVGHSVNVGEDWLRFAQEPHMKFTPSALESFSRSKDGMPALMDVFFLGLLGPNGPLPLHVTEYTLGRMMGHDQDTSRDRDGGRSAASQPEGPERQTPARDDTLRAFLDVFNHRMLALFYRAWATHNQAADFDRPKDSAFARYVGSFAGFGMDCFNGRDAVPDWSKLYFSGRLSSFAHGSEGLESILKDFFGIPVAIEPFIGEWLPLPASNLCRLGASPETGLLGQTTIVGSRVWVCQLKFRIRLGPMSYADYERMLPQGASYPRLRDWVNTYVGSELHWDVQYVLRKEEVPNSILGTAGRLGWTTWLHSKASPADVADLIV